MSSPEQELDRGAARQVARLQISEPLGAHAVEWISPFSPKPRCLGVDARGLRVRLPIRHLVGGSNLRISYVPSSWVSVVARRSRDRRHATPLVTLVFAGQVLFADLKQSYGVSAILHQRPERSPSTAGAGSADQSGASDEDSWWTRQILRKATTPGAPSRQKQHTRLLCFS